MTIIKRISSMLTRPMPFWNAFGSLSCSLTRPASCPNQGIAAGGGDNRLRGATNHRGAHKAQGVALQRVHLLRIAGPRHLLYGQGFTGE